jgi:hypothetical protein
MIIGLALVSLFAWFHIEFTAKVLGVLLVGEVLVLVVMAVAIFASGGAEGLSAAPLNPVNIFDNSAAVEVSAVAPRASRCSARSGRGSGSRWPPTTPRRPATRTRSPRPRRTAR